MNEESRLQLERYLQLVNRRKFVLVVPIVLAVLGAALLSFLQEPVYVATATARVNPAASGVDTQSAGAADRFLTTYSEIIKRRPFTDRVAQDLDLQENSANLDGRVTTIPVPNSELIEIQAKASDPDEAADIANSVTTLLRDPVFMGQFDTDAPALRKQAEDARNRLDDEQAVLGNLQTTGASESDITTQEQVVEAARNSYETLLTESENAALRQGEAARAFIVIEAAEAPGTPVSPRWMFNLAAGLLAGLAAGVALSLVLEYIDPTLRGVRDLESVTRLPVLASIPFGIRWKYPPPPVSTDYRLLSTKLRTVLAESNRKSVLFTSTREEEGNTTVATYTAMAMAQAGLRTLLLDANLSRPDLHKLFNVPMSPGLYNFISQNGVRPALPVAEAIDEIIQESPVPRLSVLTAGTKMNDPSELLASSEMRSFLDAVESKWDVVVIDGASMSSGAGSAVIASAVDGVVLVAAEGQASSTSVEDTVGELASLGAKTLGLVYCKATEA
ncbi:MAG: polysaccharide biosynthesis tyrosine autokinase [Chloroflexi bacterium]|nr:polysaccharide biosynthesis tyrosine autokinase [Chloroflexota bacterium]